MGEKIGQGREKAKEYLTEHPDAMRQIAEQIRAKFGVGEAGGQAPAEDEDEA